MPQEYKRVESQITSYTTYSTISTSTWPVPFIQNDAATKNLFKEVEENAELKAKLAKAEKELADYKERIDWLRPALKESNTVAVGRKFRLEEGENECGNSGSAAAE